MLPRKRRCPRRAGRRYTWHYPPASADRGATRQRGAARRAKRGQVTIPIALTSSRLRGEKAGTRRGISASSLIGGKARAIVLKFIARTAAGVAMKFLERNVRKGLIVMDSDDPAAWRRVSHINDLDLPDKPHLRVLLWVHGTFSSTVGSFGALAATPDGRLLLQQARERYDAVIGFDHSTLAETPHENAIDLVERLDRFRKPVQIDAVTYSRGGLVFRSLVEQILPASDTRPDVGQAVFVGVPNHGTLLADPENWKALVDIYTNLSMGAFAMLQRMPAAAPTGHILAGDRFGAGRVREVSRRGGRHRGRGARPGRTGAERTVRACAQRDWRRSTAAGRLPIPGGDLELRSHGGRRGRRAADRAGRVVPRQDRRWIDRSPDERRGRTTWW